MAIVSSPREERPKAVKKSKRLSFKKFASRTWARSITRSSTTATLVELPSLPSHANSQGIETQTSTDHVHSVLMPESSSPGPPPRQPYKSGLFPLYPPLLEGNCPVDIIALHGINGDAYTTFTAPSSKNLWLRDFLPRSFPGARIYTFGYDARVLFSLSTGDISTFANSLLEDVWGVRIGRCEKRRPIIWIAHSMGGLVVKKALTIAYNDPARYGDIHSSTTSILFMATPHRGSDHAALLGGIAEVANLPLAGTLTSRFAGKVRDDLIKDLEKDNPAVKKIAEGFGALNSGKDVTLYSFVEMKRTKPLSRRVVDEETGTMGVGGERVIYMDGEDHKSIVRFESEESPSYRKVLVVLREAVSDAVTPYLTKAALEDEPCLGTLFFRTMTQRRASASAAHPKTCTWILGHPVFKTWHSSSRGLLWIKGHPGTGKSTLMAFLHASLLSNQISKSIFLDFFFFNRGEALQKSPLGMYRTLLHQLYRKSGIARNMILEVYEEKQKAFGEEWIWQVSDLKALAKNVVTEVARKKEVMIFVDALDEAVDEAGEKAAPSLLEFFHDLNGCAAADEGCLGGVKICVSCRPYPVLGSNVDEIFVEHHNKDDMERYVREKLSTGILGWEKEPQNVHRNLVDVIVETSRGVFLWTSLQVPKVIRRLNDGEVSFEQINPVIAAESSELYDLYQNILQNDVPVHLRKKSLHLLQWICLARRALSLTELRFALACDDEDGSALPSCCEERSTFIDSDSSMEKLARSLSGGLAEVRYYSNAINVQFIHQTVNDFVRDRGFEFLASMTDAEYYSPISNMIARGENRLSRSCINYFKMEQVSKATMQWKELKYREGKPPFLEYAYRFWLGHAGRAERGGVSQENLVEQFGSSSAAYEAWLEACKEHFQRDSISPTSGTTLLHIASGWNLQSVVQKLMHDKILVDQKDSNSNTPLHWAALGGHEQMVTLLLDLGADINTRNNEYSTCGSTPLMVAARNGHERLVRLLLNKGSDVNGTNKTEGGALEEAVSTGSLPLVKLLIESGGDVNSCNKRGMNPLYEAAVGRYEAIARLLIREGADVNIQGGMFGNPLQAATVATCEPIIRLLLDSGANVNAQGGDWGNALQAACLSNENIDIAKLLLLRGADINAAGGECGSALEAACSSCSEGSEGLVRMLLNQNANVNLPGGWLGSPLIAAAEAGSEVIVAILLENGARVEVRGGKYDNVLQAATVSGNRNLVELFLAKGVDVNIAGGTYGTALQAAMRHAPSLADILLARGADVTILGGQYGNALHAAVFYNREQQVRVLLERGAGSNINTNLSDRPEIYWYHPYTLQEAAHVGNVRIVAALLDYGAEININHHVRGTALTIAAAKGHRDVFELLLDRGANIKLRGGHQTGSISDAAKKHKEINQVMLERCIWDGDFLSGPRENY
ncbi:Ankyrin repeat domain-containing protein [Lachnellula hyalina]|uniref:Ankyrin repeat domain-containing protein n=1 Tax=Lachnellula hyalina TaxID=1316788 RepID=A0A8H8QV89_9HELO|nr:Ankyrin repeat domain-containing protein [Lachnellula hyalina]TVY23462.1 Ankyrin repeat domain-containing protein [Lachnellula hyalina]